LACCEDFRTLPTTCANKSHDSLVKTRYRLVNPIDIHRQKSDARPAVHARHTTSNYMLDRFRRGADALSAIEAKELGEITSKRVRRRHDRSGRHCGRDMQDCLTSGPQVGVMRGFAVRAPNACDT
jgi:hypothetical protein